MMIMMIILTKGDHHNKRWLPEIRRDKSPVGFNTQFNKNIICALWIRVH